MIKSKLTGLLLASAALYAPDIALAAPQESTPQQTAPQSAVGADIIVTANRRSEAIQKVAASISAISGDTLTQQGVSQLDDALKNMAGVAISQGPTGLDATIRGVGPSLPANIGGDNGISTTFDGVYNQSDVTGRTGYYDLARIEVLRGPQGTLYGRNAEGGAVNIITNNPTQKLEGAVSAELGNYNLLHFTGMGNIPLTDTLALRVAGSTIKRDGYLSNGQDDNDATSFRAKLLYKPAESLSVLLGGEYSRIGGKGPGTVTTFATAPSQSVAYTSKNPTNQLYKQNGFKIWAEVNADAGPGVVTFIPAIQRLQNPELFTNTGLTNVSQPGIGAMVQKSVELRFASRPESPIEWILGGYYYDNNNATYGIRGTTVDTSGNIVLTTAAAYNILTTADSKALFGQVKVPLGQKLKLVGGLRQSWDDKSQQRTNASDQTGRASFSRLDWKAGVEYQATSRSLLYATASTGYRPGGLSPQAVQVVPGSIAGAYYPVFTAEHLTSYEIGSKNRFFGGKLKANLSGFYYQYSNYQLPQLIFIPPAVTLNVINLPKVTNYGAELETELAVSRADRLSLAVSYLHSNIDSPFTLTFPPPAVQLQNLPLPNSPRWRISANAEHDFVFHGGARLTPGVTVRYSDAYYVTIPLSANSSQPSYWQEDLSLVLTPASRAWSLSGYIKNLSKQVVKSNFIGNNMTLASPQTFGATFSAKF